MACCCSIACLQVVREASRRVLGLRPFDVQLIGGMILHEGQIAEMRTGGGGASKQAVGSASMDTRRFNTAWAL